MPAAYVYALPEGSPAETLAPLLCAGIVGYRALLRPTCRKAGGSGSTGSERPPT